MKLIRWLPLARVKILVIAIFLLGLSLRIYDLGTESLWIDEGTSIQLARSSIPQIIENRSRVGLNPPLYFIILHYWVRLFGESEFSIRLPSVIFGSLALLVIYKLGDLIFGKRVGTLSCLLLALSVFHISYSQEARGYSLMELMALISMYFFIKLLGRARFAFLVGYVFSSSLLMYTHFYGLLIILAQNIYFITMIILSNDEYELDLKTWILAQGMLLILYIPWIRFLITQVSDIQEGFWIPTPTIGSIVETFLEYSGKSKLLLLCFLALSLLGILTLERTARKPSSKAHLGTTAGCSWSLSLSNAAKIYLLLLWLAVPIILPFVISQISTPIYYTRYTIAASLAFYILIARGVQSMNNRYFKSFIVVLIVIYSLLGVNRYYTEVNKQQWRELADYIHRNAETGDLLLFNAGGIKDSAFAYYFKREDVIQKPFNLEIDQVTEHTRFYRRNGIDSLEPTVRGYNRVWLILAHSNDKQGLIKSALSELYFLSYHHKYVGIEVYLFEEPQQLVTQEIRYHMDEAGEVILAWGVNGWDVIPEAYRPAGTVVKDGLMRTPMVRQGDTFVAKVQVLAGTTLDYVFQITKTRSGTAIDVWDTNGDHDYHATAMQDSVTELQATLALSQDQTPASVADIPLVTQEIRYHMPEAGEVFLVWGINEWAVVLEENRPSGTMLKNGVMHTPMTREGDIFVTQVQVPAGTMIDYGFLITKTRSGASVYVWEANDEQDYHTIATQDGVIEVQTTLAPSQDQTPAIVADVPLVTQEIRYHIPDAGEVFLVWGVNGWAVVLEENRPSGTMLKNGVMHTPMTREGDIFVTQVQVPAGTMIDYGFLITKTRSGASVYVWEANGEQGYHTIATQDGVIEVQTTLALAQDQVTAIVADVPLVTQEIRYHMPQAGEVFLAWGINGWILVPEEIRPAGTMLKNGVMLTPMVREGDTFVAKVQVPADTTIGYGFLITKTRSGAAIEVQDANGDSKQDYYRTVAGQESVAEVQAAPWVARYIVVRDISVVDPDGEILWLCLVVLTGVCVGLVAVAVRTWIIRSSQRIYLRNLLRGSVACDILKIAVVIITIAMIGFSTVSHYGLSTDEPGGFWRPWNNLNLIFGANTATGDWKYKGPVFDIAAEIVFQIQAYLRKNLLNQDQDFGSYSYLDRMKVKHPLTFLFSLIAYVSVAGIVGILCGRKYAWLGPIALALFPRFWGHSFFNFKDIPFATLFIFSTYVGAHLVARYLKIDNRVRIGVNRVTVSTVLYGILVGLLTGIRVGGAVVIFFILIAHIAVGLSRYRLARPGLPKPGEAILKALRLGKGSIYRDFANLGALYVLMFVAWLATTILVHPASWSDPIGWLIEAVASESKHSWPSEVLFDGQFISGQALPWSYLPKWIIITVPLIFQIFFVIGLVFILYKYSRFSYIQQASIILVMLQIFFLPIFAIIKNSTIYDGMRQFIFVLPGIAAISTASLIWIYENLSRKSVRVFAATCVMIVFAQICLDMKTLHPYEYVYFNRIFGGLPNAHNRYETDYWGLSMREAMEWINKNGNPDASVVVGGPIHSASIFADRSISVLELDYDLRENMQVSKPHYYLAIPKHGLQDVFPECRVVFQVIRQGVPLTVVKQCDDQTAETAAQPRVNQETLR